MKINSTISFLLIAFMLVVGASAVASYAEPSSSAPNNNSITAIDTSTTAQTSLNILSFTEFLSGSTGFVSVDSVGEVGVGKATPDPDVWVSVEGSIRSDLLIGTNVGRVCVSTGTSALSTTVITRC